MQHEKFAKRTAQHLEAEADRLVEKLWPRECEGIEEGRVLLTPGPLCARNTKYHRILGKGRGVYYYLGEGKE
jgi:hypothetical protein